MFSKVCKLKSVNFYYVGSAVAAGVVSLVAYRCLRAQSKDSAKQWAERVFANPSLLDRAVGQIELEVNDEAERDAKARAKYLPSPANRSWLSPYVKNKANLVFLSTKTWLLGWAVAFVGAYSFKTNSYRGSSPSLYLSDLFRMVKKPIQLWKSLGGRLAPYVPKPWMANVLSGLIFVPGVFGIRWVAQKAPPEYVEGFKDWTEKAERGEMPSTIGQAGIKEQIVNMLGCGKVPVLVGLSGVGKTALVKSLTDDFVKGQFPQYKGWRIYSANTAKIAKSSYILDEALKQLEDHPNSIMFLDEVHCLEKIKEDEGSGSDEFKTQYDKVPMIAATTQAEYDKYIKPHTALKRRFIPIRVEELKEKDTAIVLERWLYQEHPDIYIGRGVIRAIIEQSNRQQAGLGQPDKALDLLKSCVRRVRLQRSPVQQAIREKLDQIAALEDRLRRRPTSQRLLRKLEGIDTTALAAQLDEDREGVASFTQLLKIQRTWNQIFANYTHRAAKNPSSYNLKAYVFIRDHVIQSASKVIKDKRKELKGLPLPIITKKIVKQSG